MMCGLKCCCSACAYEWRSQDSNCRLERERFYGCVFCVCDMPQLKCCSCLRLSICLPSRQPICLRICLSNRQFIYLPTYLPIQPCILPCMHIHTHTYIAVSIDRRFCPSAYIYLSIYLSTYLCMYLSINLTTSLQ